MVVSLSSVSLGSFWILKEKCCWQFDKHAGTRCSHHAKPQITCTRQGEVMVIHHIPLQPPSSQVPFLWCWDWWRLFPCPADLSPRSPKCVQKWDGTISTCSFSVQEHCSGCKLHMFSPVVAFLSGCPCPLTTHTVGFGPIFNAAQHTVYLGVPDTMSAV